MGGRVYAGPPALASPEGSQWAAVPGSVGQYASLLALGSFRLRLVVPMGSTCDCEALGAAERTQTFHQT